MKGKNVTPEPFLSLPLLLPPTFFLSHSVLFALCLLTRRSRLTRPQFPRIHKISLRSVDLAFVLDVLDADLETVLGEDDILLAHALRDVAAHLADAEIDLVADPGKDDEDDCCEDEGKELPELGGKYMG